MLKENKIFSMKLLRNSLFFNSVFSAITGIPLIFQSDYISRLFGIDNSWGFLSLGIGLILFSLIVFYVGKRNPIKPIPALIIIVADLIWVLASIALLLFNPFDLTETGKLLVVIIALIVFVISFLQTIGLSKIDLNTKSGLKELRYERIIDADSQTTWSIISDVANYHHVAPNIDDVKILSGGGEGMVRQCSQGDGTWTEECVLWNEGEEFSFKVDTNAPNYPFPLSYLQGTWKVLPTNSNEKSRIEMVFELRYKKKVFDILLHPFMVSKFGSIVDELLDNWESKVAT